MEIMKAENLNQGMVALVDDEDYNYLNQFNWHVKKSSNVCYAARSKRINGHPKTIRMHSVIMNSKESEIIDHIDHDGLNNQKSNLRICTHTQNMTNRRSWGMSKYLGVSFCIVAQIQVDKQKYYLGLCKTEEQAARRYDAAAKYFIGEFANLNFK